MKIIGRAKVPASADDTAAVKLEMNMLAAVARGDSALAAWRSTRNVQFLVDGLLDVRLRLTGALPS